MAVTPKSNNKASKTIFEPVRAKRRRAGTGCIHKINDNLYEGRISVKENDILKQAIGWNSTNPDEPALYCYNDENIKKYVAADGNEVLGRVIASGKLAVDKDGKFEPMSKMALRLLIIQNR